MAKENDGSTLRARQEPSHAAKPVGSGKGGRGDVADQPGRVNVFAGILRHQDMIEAKADDRGKQKEAKKNDGKSPGKEPGPQRGRIAQLREDIANRRHEPPTASCAPVTRRHLITKISVPRRSSRRGVRECRSNDWER